MDRSDSQKQYRENRRARALAEGLCTVCVKNKPPEGRRLCDTCNKINLAAQHEKKNRRRAAGVCLRCGKTKELRQKDSSWCELCGLKQIVGNHFGGIDRVSELQSVLHQQGHRCSYSGIELVLGRNASIDHRVPKASGGGNETANLHWVETRINKMKGPLSERDFLNLCVLCRPRGYSVDTSK